MKKRNLISGIVTLSLAAVLLLIVCLTETKLEGISPYIYSSNSLSLCGL